MINTLVVNVEDVVENYKDGMLEFLMSHQDDVSTREFADDLHTFSFTLKRMTSNHSELETIRAEARAGHTMMMLPEHFETLERWDRNDEDYRVAMFRENGAPVGVLNKTDLVW